MDVQSNPRILDPHLSVIGAGAQNVTLGLDYGTAESKSRVVHAVASIRKPNHIGRENLGGIQRRVLIHGDVRILDPVAPRITLRKMHRTNDLGNLGHLRPLGKEYSPVRGSVRHEPTPGGY